LSSGLERIVRLRERNRIHEVTIKGHERDESSNVSG
jgi:hypothetical protein